MTDLFLIFNPSDYLLEDMEESENQGNEEIEELLSEFDY